jgi:hypothetical protein
MNRTEGYPDRIKLSTGVISAMRRIDEIVLRGKLKTTDPEVADVLDDIKLIMRACDLLDTTLMNIHNGLQEEDARCHKWCKWDDHQMDLAGKGYRNGLDYAFALVSGERPNSTFPPPTWPKRCPTCSRGDIHNTPDTLDFHCGECGVSWTMTEVIHTACHCGAPNCDICNG